jgi:hypothetical protein
MATRVRFVSDAAFARRVHILIPRILASLGNGGVPPHPLVDHPRIRCLTRPHEVAEHELCLEARGLAE